MTLQERINEFKLTADSFADAHINRKSTPEIISEALKGFKEYEDPFILQKDMEILQKYVDLRFGQ